MPKIVQTLYFNNSVDPLVHNFEWAAPVYHLMGWALSCLQIKKFYGSVTLHANTPAAALLIDTLNLPYDQVHITHDNLILPHHNLWALPKIYTYSLQKEPFLHLDGDVFIFDKFSDDLLTGDLIAQNEEVATDYYLETQKELMTHFSYFPPSVDQDFRSDVPIKAVNAGILGGNSSSFFKTYCSEAFKYIYKNVAHLSSINTHRFNVFFEQHLFYSLAKNEEIPIKFLIKGIIKDNRYKYLGNFHEVPFARRYLHLLGDFKRDEHTCRQMATTLRDLYPEYYYRIINICKSKNSPLSINFYKEGKFLSQQDYLIFNQNSKERYDTNCYKDIMQKNDQGTTATSNTGAAKAIASLNEAVAGLKQVGDLEKEAMQKDLKSFFENFRKSLIANYKYDVKYLYGRDLQAINWYRDIFEYNAVTSKVKIIACKEIDIIKSDFNWAGVFNKKKLFKVKYYETLELQVGTFYNLIIPEVFEDDFSLYDIDEMEAMILRHLEKPMAFSMLCKVLLEYVEDDIVENHTEDYYELIFFMTKQLVLKKAIKPFNA